jgi:hypothetical protein
MQYATFAKVKDEFTELALATIPRTSSTQKASRLTQATHTARLEGNFYFPSLTWRGGIILLDRAIEMTQGLTGAEVHVRYAEL